MNINCDHVSPMTRLKKKNGKIYVRCYVTREGVRKDVHLGVWGTREAEAVYRQLCAQFYTGGPAAAEPQPEDTSLAELFRTFLLDAQRRMHFKQLHLHKRIIRIVYGLYPDLRVKDFTARTYRVVRQHLVTLSPCPPADAEKSSGRPRPWGRAYVNRLMKTLQSIIKWGISYDMVSPAVLAKIDTVPALREGEEDLHETEDRLDVPDMAVRATLSYMTPTVADMVRIQRGASMHAAGRGLRPAGGRSRSQRKVLAGGHEAAQDRLHGCQAFFRFQ